MSSSSFSLTVKLGKPVSRLIPEEILPYADPHEWQAFCDAFDRLSMNPMDKNGTLLMRLSLTIALVCLGLVVLFGYLDPGRGDSSSDENDNDDDDDVSVSTALVLVTAIPICFPFVMAAVLNCHGASTVSQLLELCQTSCHQWATAKAAQATVEQIQSVSNRDEVINQFLIQFEPLPAAKDVEAGTDLTEASPEASPEAAKE